MAQGGDVSHSKMDTTTTIGSGAKTKRLLMEDDRGNDPVRKKILTSWSGARASRARADSFDLEIYDGGGEFVKPKSKKKVLSKTPRSSAKPRSIKLDNVELVLIVDNPSTDFNSRNKVKISQEVQRIAPGSLLSGIFFMQRGGIKLVCADLNSKTRISESWNWSVDAFGSQKATCSVPRSAGGAQSGSRRMVWCEELHSFIDPVKLVLNQVPVEYKDQDLLEAFAPLAVEAVKTLPLQGGRRGLPQRLLTFKTSEAASNALCTKTAFVMDGCIYTGRYFKVVPPPVQCRRCLAYGHAATMCQAEVAKCRNCGLIGHSEESIECKAKVENKLRCANCALEHSANFYGCEVYKEAKRKAVAKAQAASVRKTNISYSSVVQGGDKASNCLADSSREAQTSCNQCSKVVAAFVAILVATHKEKDTTKLVEKSLSILSTIAPEVLNDPSVRRSLGLDKKAPDANVCQSVGITAPK